MGILYILQIIDTWSQGQVFVTKAGCWDDESKDHPTAVSTSRVPYFFTEDEVMEYAIRAESVFLHKRMGDRVIYPNPDKNYIEIHKV